MEPQRNVAWSRQRKRLGRSLESLGAAGKSQEPFALAKGSYCFVLWLVRERQSFTFS
jgi:hypothetical protein